MRKLFTFLVVLCCAMMTTAQNIEIATWSGFRKGAASFTFEDGAPSHITDAAPLFEKYGYRASFYLVVNWNPNWEGFQELADNGHEIGSHSRTHPQNMSGEEKGSKEDIEDHISNHPCLTVAYPNCNIPNKSAVATYYIAGRTCDFGGTTVISKDGPSDWCTISANMTGATTNITSSNHFVSLMDKAIRQGGWTVFGSWGFSGKQNGNATYSPTDINAIDAALKWAQQNDQNIWIAPFGDVVMYIKERKAATITVTENSSSTLAFTLTHSIADGVCAYQYPLSLKVQVSSGWEEAEVTQGTTKLTTKAEDGYLYFDAVPNGGDIVIKINTEAIEETESQESGVKTHKFLRDGQLFIERNGKTYNAQGAEVE